MVRVWSRPALLQLAYAAMLEALLRHCTDAEIEAAPGTRARLPAAREDERLTALIREVHADIRSTNHQAVDPGMIPHELEAARTRLAALRWPARAASREAAPLTGRERRLGTKS